MAAPEVAVESRPECRPMKNSGRAGLGPDSLGGIGKPFSNYKNECEKIAINS